MRNCIDLFFTLLQATLVSVFLHCAAFAQIAPDATQPGPYGTTWSEYKLPATVDADILADRITEIWARLYRPLDLSEGPHPLVIFLHGNHPTCGTGANPRIDVNCQYTSSGTCPINYVVVPNHAGYGYLAEILASWGYFVVSINANRGINCGAGIENDFGLNRARGRLILKHLQYLSEWNRGLQDTPSSLGFSMINQLDLRNFGIMGHSRGGEAARAAFVQYTEVGSQWPTRIPDPIRFRGIFEIGAIDGQTNPLVEASGVPWNQLLPMCDGDVGDLQGVKPFDRMLQNFDEPPAPKSTYTVWGANHNFFNTEWQLSDSIGCFGHSALFGETMGSSAQRQIGIASVVAFFRAHLEENSATQFELNFNPRVALPRAVTSLTRVDRGYINSSLWDVSPLVENFSLPRGKNVYGERNIAHNIEYTHGHVPRHDASQRAAAVEWRGAGVNRYLQINVFAHGVGVDIHPFRAIDIRLSRQASRANQPSVATDFTVQLVSADNHLSNPVQIGNYTDLRGPVGVLWGSFETGQVHPILQTARIPLSAFESQDLDRARGLRFTFDKTERGAIYIGDIRLSILDVEPWTQFNPPPKLPSGIPSPTPSVSNQRARRSLDQTISILALRNASQTSPTGSGQVELKLQSKDPFEVQDSMPKLMIGAKTFYLSRFPENGDTNQIIFTIPAGQFLELEDNALVRFSQGSSLESAAPIVGRLNKASLAR